jgi:hypothetical protein
VGAAYLANEYEHQLAQWDFDEEHYLQD